ncbi:MAG: amidohydrolase [Oscillospiraceae bacterium]|nr:amidohydrolase [Oscillospiraceae bacterium]
MDTLFSHVSVVTMDERMSVWTDAFVGVTDGKISHLSKKPPEEQPKNIIDGSGMVLMPGLINGHTHLPMSVLRGYADDLALQEWLNDYIFPREDRLDARTVKAATLLGIAECLRFGVTSVSDMYYFSEAEAEAFAESGMKVNLSRGTSMFLGDDFDFETFPACQELVQLHEKWHNYDNGRIKIETSIHAEYTSTYQLWDALAEYAVNNNLGMQVHVSETKSEHDSCVEKYGLTPAQVLDCHHAFNTRTTVAHGVHLTEEDMALLARRHASVVHCPVSNLKLASGCADVMGMVKSGLNVCLGTDSVASNNNLDMFEEIKACTLMAKGKTGDPTAVPAKAALMMATVCGAKAQGREAECGQIKIGMDADLILLDFNQPHLIPCHNILSNLVYAASGHDVALTMVRGKILYAAGKYPTIDLAKVMQELHEHAIPTMFSDKEKNA